MSTMRYASRRETPDEDRIDHMLTLLDDDIGTCPDCDDGVILVCCDDICNGLGYCIHGDGEEICPTCGGGYGQFNQLEEASQ